VEPKGAVFVYNAEKPGTKQVAERGAAWCAEHGVKARVTSRRQFTCHEGELAVAVGGDGTLLRTAAVLHPAEVPILGVHMGSLGFLASCSAEQLEAALETVFSGRATVEPRRRLAVKTADMAGSALNDLVLLGTSPARFTQVEVWVDGQSVAVISGDGLIVATNTGATAYALACGGPVLHPELAAMTIVPVAPHRLGIRPLVLPETASLTVRAAFPTALMLDGDPVGALSGGQAVDVGICSTSTWLVRLPEESTFFERLRDKLGWLPGPIGRG